jgi:hypothetical protein
VVREKDEVAAAEDMVSEQLQEESIRHGQHGGTLPQPVSGEHLRGGGKGNFQSQAQDHAPDGVRTADADPEVWAFLTNGW